MQSVVFVEGVSGAGKTSCLLELQRRLLQRSLAVKAYTEGDPASPLDLCWVAYVTQEEARRLTRSIRGAKEEMEQNLLLSEGDALLVRYRNREGPSCSMQLYEALRALELNYKPKRLVAPETFKRVFEELWKRFDQGEEREELLLFDGSLLSHTANDMLRNYGASAEEIAGQVLRLAGALEGKRILVLYLDPVEMKKRLQEARQSRGQSPAGPGELAFWMARRKVDLAVLQQLAVHKVILAVDGRDWDGVLDRMLRALERFVLLR